VSKILLKDKIHLSNRKKEPHDVWAIVEINMAIKIGKITRVNGEEETWTTFSERIGDGLKGDKTLKSVQLPNGVTSIGGDAFMDCSALEAISIPKSLKRIERNAFVGCVSLRQIIFPESLEEVDYWFDARRVAKTTLFNPSSDELVGNLIKGYSMDLYFKGDYREDFWD
jgi:hypothetical protein